MFSRYLPHDCQVTVDLHKVRLENLPEIFIFSVSITKNLGLFL